MKRIDLADGSYLTGSSMSSMTLFPEERVVSVSIVDGVATLTTSGPEPEVVARVAVAGNSRGSSPKAKPAAPAGEPSSKEASRWETLNGFVDVVLQTLHPTEVVVWLLL